MTLKPEVGFEPGQSPPEFGSLKYIVSCLTIFSNLGFRLPLGKQDVLR